MSESSLHSAVQNKKLTSRQGLLQKLFAVWFDAFVYNQIWEDPRIDIEALELDGDSRVLTISSGGCNALNYLIEGPRSVTAVDLNRHHIYLLNLKLAALQHLPRYEDFFEFFGEGRGPRTGANYIRHIRPHLDKATCEFWESNSLLGSLLYGERIGFFRNGGLYDHSRNGYFLKFFQGFARFSGCKTDEVLRARDAEQQEKLYRKHIDPFFDSPLIKTVGKLPVTMFGLGIPPQQYDELKKETGGDKTIIDVYRERVRRLACDFPIDENYFAWQAFARKYDTERRKAIPEYLKEENFAALRSRADRLTTSTGSIISGRAPQANDEIILDERRLVEDNVKVGDTLKLFGGKDYKIVGVFSPPSGARIKMSLAAMQEALESPGKCTYILVKVKEGVDPTAVAARINETLPGNKVNLTSDLIIDAQDRIPALGTFLRVLVGLGAFVSTIFVLLSMYTTITERRKEIGILKSLGAPKSFIIRAIEGEAFMIGVLGVVVGIATAFISSYLIGGAFDLAFEFSWGWILTAVSIAIIGSLIGALYPAWRASAIDPVEVMANE